MDRHESSQDALRVIESFDTLPLQKRLEVFSRLSSEARQELLQVVSNPGEIVRRVSEEEMFFMIKELGVEGARILIALTTGKQLQHALDVDLWKKEMFHHEAAVRWLQSITSVGQEKILHFLQVSEPELVVTMMTALISVEVRNPDLDMLEQKDSLPPFTLDDVFFVRFKVPGSEDMVIALLETVFSWNTEYYFSLMEELARGVHLENEEQARKARLARLSERGFPEFDEAVEIYRYLQRSGLSTADPEEPVRDEPLEGMEARLLEYPLKVLEQDTLFKRCLDELPAASDRDRISQELAHLANKVVVADTKNPGSVEELNSSLRKVSGYINIALEESCGENLDAAVRLVRSNHMENLFRRGFSIIMDVRKQAQQLIRNYEGGVENLGHPLAGLVQGLLQKRPQYASHVLGQGKAREFESMEDIQQIRNLLDRTTVEDMWEPI